MNKLGLAQSSVDTDLRIGFSLNEGAWTLRLSDRRTVLHKFSPFLGTACEENILSARFDAEGCVINIYSSNPDTVDGYYATHVFIPGGTIISGGELENIIEALKVGDEQKIGMYFTKDYPAEGPFCRTRFSEVSAVRYYGENGKTLKDILAHLYTIKSADYNEVFFLNKKSIIVPDGTIKDITGSELETRILTDLEPGKGSIVPDEIYVEGLLWEGTPIYTGLTAQIILKKKGFADVIIKDTEVDSNGIARFTPDWKLKIDYNTFRIADAAGENLSEYTITVNSEPVTPERSVSMPSEKAKKALVRVDRPGYQVWEKEMDLTTAVRFTITLNKDMKTRQFFIKTTHDGKQAPLELILPDMLETSPIEGYRMKDNDGDKKATLVYDPFAFLKDNKWKLIVAGIAAGILLVGFLIGLAVGASGSPKGEKRERKPRHQKDSVEVVQEEQPSAAAVSSPDAKTYLDTVKVLDRNKMEQMGIADLFDAINNYRAPQVDSILKVYGIRGNLRELADNMTNYIDKLKREGKGMPSKWNADDDFKISCERFNNNLSNKLNAE